MENQEHEDRNYEELLNIHTEGRDDSAEDDHHFPYEPTPYCVLEKLAESGWITADHLLLDYGCGKGRAGFFLSWRTGRRSIGLDFYPAFVRAAKENLTQYSGDRSRLKFAEKDAGRYEVPSGADRFYFFNPFSEQVLRSVLRRILESWYSSPRHLLLMFYYPSDAYVSCLMNMEELDFFDEIDCSELFPGDRRERILCFEICP